jgi:hypothetical protein
MLDQIPPISSGMFWSFLVFFPGTNGSIYSQPRAGVGEPNPSCKLGISKMLKIQQAKWKWGKVSCSGKGAQV